MRYEEFGEEEDDEHGCGGWLGVAMPYRFGE